jgi:hypothetical protein
MHDALCKWQRWRPVDRADWFTLAGPVIATLALNPIRACVQRTINPQLDRHVIRTFQESVKRAIEHARHRSLVT